MRTRIRCTPRDAMCHCGAGCTNECTTHAIRDVFPLLSCTGVVHKPCYFVCSCAQMNIKRLLMLVEMAAQGEGGGEQNGSARSKIELQQLYDCLQDLS